MSTSSIICALFCQHEWAVAELAIGGSRSEMTLADGVLQIKVLESNYLACNAGARGIHHCRGSYNASLVAKVAHPDSSIYRMF